MSSSPALGDLAWCYIHEMTYVVKRGCAGCRIDAEDAAIARLRRSPMKSSEIELPVSLAIGEAVVTVRIDAWPTRDRLESPGDPGEWETEDVEVACECGGWPSDAAFACTCEDGARKLPVASLSDDDDRRIGDAVQAWMANHMEDER